MIAGKSVNALLLAVLLCAAPALAGESGTARKASELKNEPYREAKTIGVLGAGDKIEILRKQGGWYHVRSAQGSGWVRMLSVRRGQARKGGLDATELVGLASGRAGTGQVVSNTGIRGLSEEELKAAQYNGAELRRLESFGTPRAEAHDFATRGGLKARTVN